MGPTYEQTHEYRVKLLTRELQREQLNPFDLLKWEDLFTLFIDLRLCIRRKTSHDAQTARGLLMGMKAALQRKAEDFQMVHESDERIDSLEQLNQS
jgi:hypothetical protein